MSRKFLTNRKEYIIIYLNFTNCKGSDFLRIYLLELREANGLTQKEISSKLGISESYYNLIEKGERQKTLRVDLLKQLSSVLNVTLDKLVDYELTYSNAIN